MNKVLRLVLFCLTLLIALPALAQEIQVKGRVIDEKGEAIIGAAVKVKESTKGALTDLDGNSPYRLLARAISSSPSWASRARPSISRRASSL